MKRPSIVQRSLAAVALVLSGLLLPAGAVAQGGEIEPGLFRLDGIEDGLPSDDLRPLEAMLETATVVGLGEAVHTNRGFSRVKVRLFQFLVEEMGYRAFGFESPWIAAESVADYVRDCEGSALDALEGLFAVWQNESVLDLVEWMCSYNQQNPDDPVHFYGFDIQFQAEDEIAALQEFLLKVGVRPGSTRYRWLNDCSISRILPQQFRGDDHERCLTALDKLWKRFVRKERQLLKKVSKEELEWAKIHVVGLRSWENEVFFFDSDFARAFSARDEGMAYVALAIPKIRFPGARVALWAHNAHLAKRTFERGVRVMGQDLAKALRKEYKVLGLVAHEADIDWPGVGCGPYETARPGSVEALLRDLGEPYLLVDLAFPGAGSPLLEPRKAYEINWGWRMVPGKAFDALLYQEKAERMVPVLRSPC